MVVFSKYLAQLKGSHQIPSSSLSWSLCKGCSTTAVYLWLKEDARTLAPSMHNCFINTKLCVILLVQPIYNQMVFSQLDQQTNSRISEIWEPSQSQIPKIPWSSLCTFTCDHTQVLLRIISVAAAALNSSYINLFDPSHICDCSLAFSISLTCVLSCIIALYPASCYIWANSIQWMPSLCKMGHKTWQIIHLKGDIKP
jgi:hypothetical protein